MSGFWWIIMHNWTFKERMMLRHQCEAWMAANVGADK